MAIWVPIVTLLFIVGLLTQGAKTWAAVPQLGVEFQDGAGNAKDSAQAGETAIFYVRDAGLETVHAGTATWTDVPARVPANSWWSLATGAPHPDAYALSPGTSYDTSTPSNTPLASTPAASVNGVTFFLGGLNTAAGEFALLNAVNTSSSVVITFTFDIVDVYADSAHRVKVTSSSDDSGEWAAIKEVQSETDSSASPTSGLLRGEVGLSADAAAEAPGDGAVLARPGDTLTVTYYGPDGATSIATDQLQVVAGALAALPTADWVALSILAAAFALLATSRLRRGSQSGMLRGNGMPK